MLFVQVAGKWRVSLYQKRDVIERPMTLLSAGTIGGEGRAGVVFEREQNLAP
ncbi:hypothetical protein WL1483_700 [Aeromonas schubertii]|uniref:Uncharacterized protein n=1 Tax=Aeromonas schubertii TaxID=652 RepID=A0A0S2SEI3_9GAMM|nr:hypothetical protein WL1483_700 [Aeromonas schubertii]